MINKYGDLYGAERIAELLGLDKSALDFDPTVETVEREASLVSWWELRPVAVDTNSETKSVYMTLGAGGRVYLFAD